MDSHNPQIHELDTIIIPILDMRKAESWEGYTTCSSQESL